MVTSFITSSFTNNVQLSYVMIIHVCNTYTYMITVKESSMTSAFKRVFDAHEQHLFDVDDAVSPKQIGSILGLCDEPLQKNNVHNATSHIQEREVCIVVDIHITDYQHQNIMIVSSSGKMGWRESHWFQRL